MTTRTTRKTVRFSYAFTLKGIGSALPAGSYDVDTDEERLENLSFAAYRRTLTQIHLRNLPGQPGITRIVPIDGDELDAALRRDRATVDPAQDTRARDT
ncbi:MAG: hypothetical protein RIM84_22180 [Alphaproteobacteria bacterium]